MEALKPSEVLSRAADLIEPEGKWTQGDYARDAGGEGRWPSSNDATCWCAIGAIRRCAPDSPYRALAYFAMAAGGSACVDFNDAPHRTQAEVVAALRRASELAKADGQ